MMTHADPLEPKYEPQKGRNMFDACGLSSKDLSSWQKAGFAPSIKSAPQAHRYMDTWQLTAVRIGVELYKRFGILPSRSQTMMHWCCGEVPTIRQLTYLSSAWDAVFKLLGLATPGFYKIAATFQYIPGQIYINDYTEWPNIHAQLQAIADDQKRLDKLIGAAKTAGFDSESLSDLHRLYKMTWKRFGTGTDIMRYAAPLFKQNMANKDLKFAFVDIAAAAVPIFEAETDLMLGLPTYLYTTGENSIFVSMDKIYELSHASVLGPSIIYPVRDAFNLVRTALGKTPYPNLTTIESKIAGAQTEKEVLAILRSKKFDRLTIEKRGQDLRFVLERNFSDSDVNTVKDLIRESAFQTITIRVNNDKIVQIRQETSIKGPH